jgi:putative membrane protein
MNRPMKHPVKQFLAAAAFFAATGASLASPAAGEPAPAQILSTDLSGGDIAFFTGASRQIALAAGLSAMARDRATTPEVKQLAAGIATEQTGAEAKLKDLAALKHVPLEAETDAAGKKQLQALAKLKGPKFDKSYLDALADAQDALQQSLESGAASADPGIQSLAQSALATLKQERLRVRRLGM